MGFLSDTWSGFTNYLNATQKEVEAEYDEFQKEIDKTSSYEQSTASDLLQQSYNGVSFAFEAVGSVVNNDATRAAASEAIDEITSTQTYQRLKEEITEGANTVAQETRSYLDAHPALKSQLQEINHAIDNKIDEGVDAVKALASEHQEALRNIESLGGLVATAVPVAKGAKLLSQGEKSLTTAFTLSAKKNQARFENKILPELKNDFDFTTQEKPTLHFTGGLPGSGKGDIVREIKSQYDTPKIIIADPDNFRGYHPDIEEIQETFGHDASIITHPDASIWSKKTLDEALSQKADVIKDGTLNSAESFIKIGTEAKKYGYALDVNIKAVNEYESLEGVFGRFAHQYADKPSEARFVPPSYVKEIKPKIEDAAERVSILPWVEEFKIVNREGDVIYDKATHYGQSAKHLMQEATSLKNYSKEKIDDLEQRWDSTIEKLKAIDAPKEVQHSAKQIRHELAVELSPVQARVMSKEAGIMTAGVTTAVAADTLQSNHEIDYTQYLPEHLRPNQPQQIQAQASIHPPSVQTWLDQFKSSDENMSNNSINTQERAEQAQESQTDGIDPTTGYYTNLPDSVNQYFERSGILPHQQQDNEDDRGMDID